jgi:hypothetical protein
VTCGGFTSRLTPGVSALFQNSSGRPAPAEAYAEPESLPVLRSRYSGLKTLIVSSSFLHYCEHCEHAS